MKKFLGLAVLALAAPVIADDFIDNLMQRYRLNWDDAALIGGLSRDFKLDPSVVLDTRNRYGMHDDDLISTLYFRRNSRRDMDDIYRMRESGMGWGEIAHKIGMHPGEFNKMRKSWGEMRDRDLAEDLWRDQLRHRSKSDLDWARNKNLSWRDIYVADKASRDRNKNFRDILTGYRRDGDWGRVGGAFDPRYDGRWGNDRPGWSPRKSDKNKKTIKRDRPALTARDAEVNKSKPRKPKGKGKNKSKGGNDDN
ncbi:MAG: hypothetical protein H0W86_05515 [Armatimonadetes bacterium]|nr:hypothetical protein [Armatimonadota bacterium]